MKRKKSLRVRVRDAERRAIVRLLNVIRDAWAHLPEDALMSERRRALVYVRNQIEANVHRGLR